MLWQDAIVNGDRDCGSGRTDDDLLPGVSVVVPAYRSATTLPALVAQIEEALAGVSHEIVLVDDGSNDGTWREIGSLTDAHSVVRGLRLGRNAGQHAALLAGVRAARHRVTVTIDDDLQNPPGDIPRLVRALDELACDVAYGAPRKIAHPTWRRASSFLVRRMTQATLGVDEIVHMSSFRAFRTPLRNAFDARIGPGVSLDSLLAWGTDAFRTVEVGHAERETGQSNYSFGKLVRFALDTLTGYTTLPLRAASLLGFTTAALGVLLLIVFVLVPFVRGISIQGFPFLASTIIFFAGVQLVTLGVIGEYLARMHFRIMNRPSYVVTESRSGSRDD